jgi:hypothetical protein
MKNIILKERMKETLKSSVKIEPTTMLISDMMDAFKTAYYDSP